MDPVLCDVDGVVADMLPRWLELYNADYGDALTVPDITAWDVSLFVKPECGARIFDYLEDPRLYEGCAPVRGALEGVRAVREMGRRIVFVTDCSGPRMVKAKVEWLLDHGLIAMPVRKGMGELIVARDKSLFRGFAMVDDYPVNLARFPGRRILLDTPYNQDAADVVRVHSWGAVVDALLSPDAD